MNASKLVHSRARVVGGSGAWWWFAGEMAAGPQVSPDSPLTTRNRAREFVEIAQAKVSVASKHAVVRVIFLNQLWSSSQNSPTCISKLTDPAGLVLYQSCSSADKNRGEVRAYPGSENGGDVYER